MVDEETCFWVQNARYEVPVPYGVEKDDLLRISPQMLVTIK